MVDINTIINIINTVTVIYIWKDFNHQKRTESLKEDAKDALKILAKINTLISQSKKIISQRNTTFPSDLTDKFYEELKNLELLLSLLSDNPSLTIRKQIIEFKDWVQHHLQILESDIGQDIPKYFNLITVLCDDQITLKLKELETSLIKIYNLNH